MGGPSYIPFSEIEAYCNVKNIFLANEKERLVRLVDVLDREWMKNHSEKMDRESKKSPKKPPVDHSPLRSRPAKSTRTEVR